MYERYAIYAVPQGAFGQAGAAWLGWDSRSGQPLTQPALAGLDLAALTDRPRRYGFHATIKAPFHLPQSTPPAALDDALDAVAATLRAPPLGRLRLSQMGRFLALTPETQTRQLTTVVADVVTGLDRFRAPLTQDAFERRAEKLRTERHKDNLRRWGAPHVLDDFRFHITLTGPIARPAIAAVTAAAHQHFAPYYKDLMVLNQLALMGQDSRGFFHVIRTVTLPE